MKKTLLKVLSGLSILIVLIVIAGFAYLKWVLPKNIPAPDIVVELSEARIQRGAYLVRNVAACLDCHTEREWTLNNAPVKASKIGAGGELWGHEMGFPGEVYSSNITPAAMADWTDGELYRAITSGISKDGRALFPLMPYDNYAKLPEEDIYDIIAYLRTLEAKEGTWPERQLDFPLNLIVNTIPMEGEKMKKPPKSDQVAYGKYLVTMASCGHCHTPSEKGEYIEELAYAGGMQFPLPTGGTAQAANITPDRETGIGAWTEETFMERFREYAPENYTARKIIEGEFNSPMPWIVYGRMHEEDLQAIFAYLRSLNPVINKVEKFIP